MNLLRDRHQRKSLPAVHSPIPLKPKSIFYVPEIPPYKGNSSGRVLNNENSITKPVISSGPASSINTSLSQNHSLSANIGYSELLSPSSRYRSITLPLTNESPRNSSTMSKKNPLHTNDTEETTWSGVQPGESIESVTLESPMTSPSGSRRQSVTEDKRKPILNVKNSLRVKHDHDSQLKYWQYFRGELTSTDFDQQYDVKSERVINFLAVPLELEKVLSLLLFLRLLLLFFQYHLKFILKSFYFFTPFFSSISFFILFSFVVIIFWLFSMFRFFFTCFYNSTSSLLVFEYKMDTIFDI